MLKNERVEKIFLWLKQLQFSMMLFYTHTSRNSLPTLMFSKCCFRFHVCNTRHSLTNSMFERFVYPPHTVGSVRQTLHQIRVRFDKCTLPNLTFNSRLLLYFFHSCACDYKYEEVIHEYLHNRSNVGTVRVNVYEISVNGDALEQRHLALLASALLLSPLSRWPFLILYLFLAAYLSQSCRRKA